MEFLITDEILKRAVTYMPIAEKAATAKVVARECLQRDETPEAHGAFPPLWRENQHLKALMLMQILLTDYLGVNIGIDGDFNSRVYDKYGKSHVLNQLERYKGNAELKDTVFDILTDYKDLRKMIDAEIYAEKAKRNDTLLRLSLAADLAATPENVKAIAEEIARMSDEMKEEGAK